MTLVFFLIAEFMAPAVMHADNDWGALEQALKDAGIISDPPAAGAGTPPAGTGTPPQGSGATPTGGAQGAGTDTGTSPPAGGSTTPTTPTPPTGTPPAPPQGPVFPTGPDGKTLPLPPPSQTSFPYDSGNTGYGEYESEGGKLWRDFRDGKLTSEQYQQRMRELRDRIREREERERREQEERERPEREARQRAAREEAEARSRERRRRREERRRERERKEREEREEQGQEVGMSETGDATGIFQAVDSLHAGFPQGGSPSARDMGPMSPEVAQREPSREHHHE